MELGTLRDLVHESAQRDTDSTDADSEQDGEDEDATTELGALSSLYQNTDASARSDEDKTDDVEMELEEPEQPAYEKPLDATAEETEKEDEEDHTVELGSLQDLFSQQLQDITDAEETSGNSDADEEDEHTVELGNLQSLINGGTGTPSMSAASPANSTPGCASASEEEDEHTVELGDLQSLINGSMGTPFMSAASPVTSPKPTAKASPANTAVSHKTEEVLPTAGDILETTNQENLLTAAVPTACEEILASPSNEYTQNIDPSSSSPEAIGIPVATQVYAGDNDAKEMAAEKCGEVDSSPGTQTADIANLLEHFHFTEPDICDDEHACTALDTLQEWAGMIEEGISATNDNITQLEGIIKGENMIMTTAFDPEGMQALMQDIWRQSLLEAQAEWFAWQTRLQVGSAFVEVLHFSPLKYTHTQSGGMSHICSFILHRQNV